MNNFFGLKFENRTLAAARPKTFDDAVKLAHTLFPIAQLARISFSTNPRPEAENEVFVITKPFFDLFIDQINVLVVTVEEEQEDPHTGRRSQSPARAVKDEPVVGSATESAGLSPPKRGRGRPRKRPYPKPTELSDNGQVGDTAGPSGGEVPPQYSLRRSKKAPVAGGSAQADRDSPYVVDFDDVTIYTTQHGGTRWGELTTAVWGDNKDLANFLKSEASAYINKSPYAQKQLPIGRDKRDMIQPFVDTFLNNLLAIPKFSQCFDENAVYIVAHRHVTLRAWALLILYQRSRCRIMRDQLRYTDKKTGKSLPKATVCIDLTAVNGDDSDPDDNAGQV